MDGLEATRALRKREEVVGGRTPIVAMTAYVMDADRRKCIEAGMDDYVSKPIDKTELRDALRRASRNTNQQAAPGQILEQADILADCLPDQSLFQDGPSTAEEAASPIDMDRIVENNAGDADLVREMAELFVDECPRMLQQIRDALAQRDTKLLSQSAHFLRGSLVNFTDGPAVQALSEIEEACRGDDIQRAALAWDQLQEHLGRITPVLRSFARQGCSRP
jgi:HPt (histidine-containing phosphotransfer) domain-containing protein